MSRIPIASLANGVLLATQTFASPANPEGVPVLTPGISVSCQLYLHNTTTPAPVWTTEGGSTPLALPLVTDTSGTVPGWIDPTLLPLDLVVALSTGPETFVLAGGSGGGSGVATSGTTGTNLGATQTIDFGSTATEKWLVGTLNANLTVTVANYVPGCKAQVRLTQDGTGGRTLTVSDVGGPASVPIPLGIGAQSAIEVEVTDTGQVYVTPLSVPGPAGPTGATGATGPTGPQGAAGSGGTIAGSGTLPSSPVDGQVFSLLADDTTGVEWLMRWDAAKGLWRCIGGGYISQFAAMGSTVSLTTAFSSPAGVPSITLPNVGTGIDGSIEYGLVFFTGTAGASVFAGIEVGAVAPLGTDTLSVFFSGATGTATPTARTPLKQGASVLAPGAVLTMQLKAGAVIATPVPSNAWLKFRPIQIHP